MWHGVLVSGMTAVACGIARAQCEQWISTGPAPGVNTGVTAVTVWDPDDAGPQPGQLIIGGSFTLAHGVLPVNRLARWNGSVWEQVGPTLNNAVGALTTWDPDGGGPGSSRLVAAGSFTFAGVSQSLPGIGTWNGVAWQALGTGLVGLTRALCTWDPDGTGPLNPLLVAAGGLTSAGGALVGRIAAWDGSAWQNLAGGVNGEVYGLAVWDSDGPGPAGSGLVTVGDFSTAGGVTAHRIARWDGVQWHPIGSATQPTTFVSMRSVANWDPDGAGSFPGVLVVGGNFTSLGGKQAKGVAFWDGIGWAPLGGGVTQTSPGGPAGQVMVLTPWDPDGPGPRYTELIVAGGFAYAGGLPFQGLALFDGIDWEGLGQGAGNAANFVNWDPDGLGPASGHLVAGGSVSHGGIARWSGSTWLPFGGGPTATVQELAAWDPDESGPVPPRLICAGDFTSVAGVPANRIASWDGSTWQPLGTGVTSGINAVMSWDPDANGPATTRLVVGGAFTTAGGTAASRIAAWDGTHWSSFGEGFSAPTGSVWVRALAAWDPDDLGPQESALIAGGWFTESGTTQVNRVARWDGSAWQPLGAGLNGLVESLAVWDSDGPAAIPPFLVVGGSFNAAGGAPANGIAVWDGSTWDALGSGLQNGAGSLLSWDPDGAGPVTPHLFAVGTSSVNRWTGSVWQAAGAGSFNGSVMDLTLWAGAAGATRVIASGEFTIAGGTPAKRVAQWDGVIWSSMGAPGGGVEANRVEAVTSWDADGAGPRPPLLVVGGSFSMAGGLPSQNLAIFGCPPPPPCYPDCDQGGTLTITDFGCFQTKFVGGDPYADCDDGGTLTIADFACFQMKFVAGCP